MRTFLMDEHPINRPIAYFALIAFCTMLGGVLGHNSVTYGIRGYWQIHALAGFGIGIFLAVLLRLLFALADT